MRITENKKGRHIVNRIIKKKKEEKENNLAA